MPAESDVECAIAMVCPEGKGDPVCEMFRVDRRTGRWSSKHFSSGTCFLDGGRLYNGETARSLAEHGTGSGIHRYSPRQVTFVIAALDAELFERTAPTDWTVDQLRRLPGANITTVSGTHHSDS